MYYQGEAEKKERRKIVAVSIIAVILILLLIIAIIVVAVKKSHRVNIVTEENTSLEVSEKTETKKEDVVIENGVKTTENTTETTIVIEEPKVEVKEEAPAKATAQAETKSKEDDIPSTGPEDALPVALLLGTLVAYLSSSALAKREA